MINAGDLHKMIAQVCPVDSVSVGDPLDKATWIVKYLPYATDDQKAKAVEIVAACDSGAPTPDDIRAEASRRMQLLCGARNKEHLDVLVANAVREAVRLQNIRLSGQEWTDEQRARASQLIGLDMAIEAIRAASNAMEPNPPRNYKDDANWPKVSG